ncbi:FAD-dependent oxidoreductase [Olivibacter sp. SDN3]|uniref:FAD-dependent oxidoreductase n=1 Tax=Olivibacter sp. SDN3 TaxID=2764720 RepID=UPI0016516A86|nr:FAD-dependent oxidoreductase [Olivibacter sp. SDN3]QNL51452.1 FAD-dependent oxidoreductase [Olivibacter sp. SDN3]
MNRRKFITDITVSTGCLAASPSLTLNNFLLQTKEKRGEIKADTVIIGGGLGGCAAALAALRNGQQVILTEETDWLGGQTSQQGVPPDEHQWIETHGAPCSYQHFRGSVREYYRRNYPLTADAKGRKHLNPGDGSVSRLCHEPTVALAILTEMLAPYISSGKLTLLMQHKAVKADVNVDQVMAITVRHTDETNELVLQGSYFVDATELGDLLPLSGTAYVKGVEPKKETKELHAPETGDPENQQAFTMCLAMDYTPGENHVIDQPRDYHLWRDFVPELSPPWSGKLLDLAYSSPRTLEPSRLGFHPEGVQTGDCLNLWNYRKLINRHNFLPGTYAGDITVMNWPQNDYFLGNLIDVDTEIFKKHVDAAKQLSLSLFYWLQTTAPRPDGGEGWPGLRLRGDIMGTSYGLAKYPYVRESRRIKALFTVLEEHVGAENRALVTGRRDHKKAAPFYDSVGIGYYHIDLHPSSGGNNYIDFSSLPFQIPLGALLPIRMKNLLPANKNIGTTHITNGCYRLHPVEWSIGEAVGLLTTYAHEKKVPLRAIRENPKLLTDFQHFLHHEGIETNWRHL